jgi:hypothetical protein
MVKIHKLQSITEVFTPTQLIDEIFSLEECAKVEDLPDSKRHKTTE